MDLPQTGRCQCGATTYALEAEPLTVYACHCHKCQRQSGGAFGMTALVPADALRFTGAPPAINDRTSDGAQSHSMHCATCGSRICNVRPGSPTVALKPGTLDDTSWVRPVTHIWTESAQGWTAPLRTGLCFERQDFDFDALRRAWAERDA